MTMDILEIEEQGLIHVLDQKQALIIVVEDDPDDRLLIQKAFQLARFQGQLKFLGDGEMLLEYLRGFASVHFSDVCAYPQLILLDLNMPKKDGREVLVEIHQDQTLKKRPPIIVMTTSKSAEDAAWARYYGAIDFYTKPSLFQELVDFSNKISLFLKNQQE